MTLYSCHICGQGIYDDIYLAEMSDKDRNKELKKIQADVDRHYDDHKGLVK